MPLAAAAVRLETKKKRLGSNRSASPRKALIRVPLTNPSCIILVNNETRVDEKSCSNTSDGTMAVVENHRAIVKDDADSKYSNGTVGIFRTL